MGFFRDIVLVAASTPVRSSGGGGYASWPLTGMGVEADWAFTPGMEVYWDDGVVFEGTTEGQTASLTGGAVATFDAAVSNSTACTVTLTPTSTWNGTVFVTMKGGTPVAFVGLGDSTPVAHTVTSGTGSGFVLTAGPDGPGLLLIGPAIAITLA